MFWKLKGRVSTIMERQPGAGAGTFVVEKVTLFGDML